MSPQTFASGSDVTPNLHPVAIRAAAGAIDKVRRAEFALALKFSEEILPSHSD